jgi:hypothetical protein
MPATYTTLTLSNGFTVADLVDGTNYALLSGSWAPAVASRRVSRMGGLPLYEDVIEEISLTVMGSTAAAALENLAKLSLLLDRAEAWSAGDGTTPTLLTCQPQGSTLSNPLRSVVLGRPQGEGPLLALPPTFNDKLMVYEIAPVTISFLRRGQWLGETDAATSSAAANPSRLLATFASATEIPGPAVVSLDGFEEGGDLEGPGYLLLCPDESISRFVLAHAPGVIDTGSVADWSSVNEGVKYAYGTNVARFGPAGTIYTTPLVDVTITGVAQVAIFAAVRNNTTGATWQIAMQHYSLNGGASTPLVTVDDSDLDPQIVYLGMLSHPLKEHRFQLVLQGDNASASIDINYFVFLPVTPETHVIALQRNFMTVSGSEPYSLAVDPREIAAPTPQVLINKDSGGSAPTQQPASYRGDAYVHQIGQYLAAMLLLPHGENWRLSRLSVAVENTLTVTRRRAYLTPL